MTRLTVLLVAVLCGTACNNGAAEMAQAAENRRAAESVRKQKEMERQAKADREEFQKTLDDIEEKKRDLSAKREELKALKKKLADVPEGESTFEITEQIEQLKVDIRIAALYAGEEPEEPDEPEPAKDEDDRPKRRLNLGDGSEPLDL